MLGTPSPPPFVAPATPPPVEAPSGTRPQKKSITPSFLGALSLPQQSGSSVPGKTLLGQ
jgi:hypothetical protein